MRRFAILVAILAAFWSSWATASPPQRLAGRLQQYDQGVTPARARRESATPARYQRPSRSTYPQARQADYQEAAPAYHREDLPPGQVAEGPIAEGPVQNEWTGNPSWEYGDGEFYEGGFGDACGADCCGWGRAPGLWGRAEYLYWWVRGGATPPLVTTSPDNTPRADAGVLPDAAILFGDERLNKSGRSGGRFTLGYWFNCCDYTGIDTTFLFLGNVNQQYYNSSGGSPILARPFFNVNTELQDAQLLAFPGVVVGSISASSSSRVYGGDVNIRRALFVDCWTRFDVLAGYRYFRLAEDLGIDTRTTSIDPNSPVAVGTRFAIFDSFQTRNNFNGGQLGVNAQLINGCWTLDLLAKLAIGSTSQTVTINGGTTTTTPNGQTSSATGGVLALDSNIGTYNRNQFAVLPEFGVDLRYQLTPLWRLNLGYTLMVATNVVRPGDQIDLNIDPDQFPPNVGGTQPKFVFHDSDVWLQGINFGIECNF